MIGVFGGTTEGKQVANWLDQHQLPYRYATKTNTHPVVGPYGKQLSGALDAEGMKEFFLREQIDLLVDAAHPFAIHLHETLFEVSRSLGIQVVRMEREVQHADPHPLIHYVGDYPEAVKKLEEMGAPDLLALSGVQSISKLQDYWRTTRTWFRILDRPESVSIAESERFPKEQLILGFPGKSINEEVTLYKRLNIGAILTKESGDSGSQSLKMEAALRAYLPIVIICRPTLPAFDLVIHKVEELGGIFTKTLAP